MTKHNNNSDNPSSNKRQIIQQKGQDTLDKQDHLQQYKSLKLMMLIIKFKLTLMKMCKNLWLIMITIKM
jgi:hypothetical protein